MWLEVDDDGDEDDRTLAEVFHAKLDKEALKRIPALFSKDGGNLRVLISTVAFGLGMDIPDIRNVVHWGVPDDCLAYWQEVGRCARSGQLGNAFMYLPPFALSRQSIDDKIKAFVSFKKCLRRYILEYLFVDGMNVVELEIACKNDRCCSICDSDQSVNE